jgi:hypothetical protein
MDCKTPTSIRLKAFGNTPSEPPLAVTNPGKQLENYETPLPSAQDQPYPLVGSGRNDYPLLGVRSAGERHCAQKTETLCQPPSQLEER